MTFYENNNIDYTSEIMKMASSMNPGRSNLSAITPISQYSPIKYNSVNVAVGRRGSGKTHAFMKEFIRIGEASSRTHMLIYVSKNLNVVDPTFEKFRDLIPIPIEIVEAEFFEEYIKNIIMYKEYYEKIIEQDVVDDLTDDLVEEFQQVLKIKDFSERGLHTLIFIDDCVFSSLLTQKSYVTSLLSENRQPRLSFFLSIQFWKGLIPSIKPNINTLFVFGSFSKQQLSYILQQIPLNTSFDVFHQMYRQLNNRCHVIIDTDEGCYRTELSQ